MEHCRKGNGKQTKEWQKRMRELVRRGGQNLKDLLGYFETVTPNLLFKDTVPERAEVPLVFLSLDPARFFVLLGFRQLDGPVLGNRGRFCGHKKCRRHRMHGRVGHFPYPRVAVLAVDADH